MQSKLKLMEDTTFFVHLIKAERSMLELFLREQWLAKKLLNNSVLYL